MAITNKPEKQASTVGESAPRRRFKYGLSSVLLVAALALILAVVNWFSSDAAARFDLTSRGRYSISEQTQQLLDSLDEDITVSLVFSEKDPTVSSDEQRARAADRRQVEDVLRELKNASDRIKTVRIDPTDPRTIGEYDALIERLNDVFSEDMAVYRSTIDIARDTLLELAEFAGPQAEALNEAMGSMSPQHERYRTLQTIAQVLAILPSQVGQIDQQVEQYLEVDPAAGIRFPDLTGAASLLRTALSRQAPTLSTISDFYTESINDETVPVALRDRIRNFPARFSSLASRMLDQSDALSDLPPLKLSSVQFALARRNCVLLEGDNNAIAIEYDRLFPPPGATQVARGEGVDRRFGGETVLAAGIRQLTLDSKPVMVICHAEQTPTLLRGAMDRPDLNSVAMQMRDLGFEIREWNVGQERPEIEEQGAGQTVWVIVPTIPNPQSMAGDVQLADATAALIAEGERVLVSVYPSLVPALGQDDPWNGVFEPLGLRADNGRVVFEEIPQPGGEPGLTDQMEAVNYESDHPIARAVDGQPTVLELVVPIVVEEAGESSSAFDATTIYSIEPSERVWASSEWLNPTGPTPPAERDTEAYKVIVALERATGPLAGQRLLVVGSGRWFWSSRAGVYDVSTGMRLPMYPGNSELFAASVAWLSGLDSLIARSPRAQSVPRIESLGRGARTMWQWILIGGVPLLVLAGGVAVGLSRRG